MQQEVTMTKKMDSNFRIRLDRNARQAAGIKPGDLVEIKIRPIGKVPG
jgi:bifunctional DNA-binding transcriptional regulator/antitoxin component of YhaV-PrlF toxin-antitoxin module